MVVSAVCLLASGVLAQEPRRPAETKIDPVQHLSALDPRWIVSFDTPSVAAAGFDEQTAYVPLKGGELVAVGLDRGDRRWKVDLATSFTPAAGDGFVFAAAEDAVVAFDERTGAIAWRTAIGGAIAAPVFFDAGLVLVAKTDGELLSIRAQDGVVAWRRGVGAEPAAPPSAAGDRLYVGLKDHHLLALDRETGTTVWTLAAGDEISGILALGDQVLFGTRGNRVYSVRPSNARLRWQWRVGADVMGAPAADEHRIYFAALDNVLRAVDRASGNLAWSQPLPSRPSAGPFRTGDVVIVPTVSADIGAYSAASGKPAFTIRAAGELGGALFLRDSPRPTAPRLIAVSRGGTLQGFAPRYEPPPGPLDALPGAKVGSD
ncbi:MAG TPA: PQQ-binding-like beta-propeller repeat protein [Vicinamibacterales bacterium]|nr:PQQ-binding-like beta-propeller repeat protein [Vicinamibacterales bacterium]